MVRALTIAALTLGLLAAGASPALAAKIKPFDIWTGTDFTQGRAHAYGEVDYTYGLQATVRGRLNDVCPGDGHGAYLRVTFILSNGNTRQQSAKDVSGCTNADGIDFTLHVSAPHDIVAVKLYLYEYDADRNSTADTATKRINR